MIIRAAHIATLHVITQIYAFLVSFKSACTWSQFILNSDFRPGQQRGPKVHIYLHALYCGIILSKNNNVKIKSQKSFSMNGVGESPRRAPSSGRRLELQLPQW